MGITDSFKTFCDNIKMSSDTISKIQYRYHQITKRINNDYWNITSDTSHSLYVGSYGRDTEIYTSDIDMLVQLPSSVYHRFNNHSTNGQSNLLQEVKSVLQKTYSTSHSKGDGQIISINFDDGINFEILPAFENTDGKSFTFGDSNSGGKWKVTNPRAEMDEINRINNQCNGNLKMLCKMARVWKAENNVDISGILIDILACRFIVNWSNKDKSYLYYDFMSRDFFKYLSELTTQSSWKAMGSDRYIYDNGYFQAKAKKAYNLALEAIQYGDKHEDSANQKWREIYGTKFPS